MNAAMWVPPDKESELFLCTQVEEEGDEREEVREVGEEERGAEEEREAKGEVRREGEEREGGEEERAQEREAEELEERAQEREVAEELEREAEAEEERAEEREGEEEESCSDDDDNDEGFGCELEMLSAHRGWLAIHKKPWMFRLLGCLACQSGFRQLARRQKSACGGGRESFTTSGNPAIALAPLPLADSNFNALLHSSCSFCCCMMPRMKDMCSHLLAKKKGGPIALESQFGQIDAEVGCLSTRLDGLSLNLGDLEGEDVVSCSDSSSPFSWSKLRSEDSHSATCSRPSNSMGSSEGGILWEDTKHEMWSTSLPEVEMMKERFVKLLLGEDMSGSGNGVCSALALSNAITNLSASVFGEIWRLEPLPDEKKKMWHREMEWLLAITDHIREFIPSSQTLPNGSIHEVMVSRPRADLYVNLPALQKLDAMLLETLDKFREMEFWYVEQGLDDSDENGRTSSSLPRQVEKWWLPSPKLPPNGLSSDGRKHLLQQHECVSQILKAALAINSQILFEMDIPEAYLEALPKNGKAMVGDTIYKHITSERFCPEALLCLLDLSNEHRALDIANRIEAAIHVWGGQKQLVRDVGGSNSKATWGLVKDLIGDVSKRETLTARAENLLLCLKRKFPGLPQTLLDITKIQYNRDVGRSILESYSRVTETLASNILARIEDILFADDMLKGDPSPPPKLVNNNRMATTASIGLSLCTNTPYGTPVTTPDSSPTRFSPLNDAHIYGLLHKNIVDNNGLSLSPSQLINAQRVLQCHH